MSRGIAAAVAVILATEAGIPVPVPADLVLLALGERAGAHVVPLWVVMIAVEVVVILGTCGLFFLSRRIGQRMLDRLGSRRPSIGAQVDRVRSIIDRRGNAGFAVGRATPGLRTITVLVAALSTVPAGRALAVLIAGGSAFVQGHVLLGLALGPAARSALEDLPIPGIALIAILAAGALVLWTARRGRSSGPRGWIEGSCPACLALGLPGDRPPERRDGPSRYADPTDSGEHDAGSPRA
jgi:membrane protein DedA with SNARE-associated domain